MMDLEYTTSAKITSRIKNIKLDKGKKVEGQKTACLCKRGHVLQASFPACDCQ